MWKARSPVVVHQEGFAGLQHRARGCSCGALDHGMVGGDHGLPTSRAQSDAGRKERTLCWREHLATAHPRPCPAEAASMPQPFDLTSAGPPAWGMRRHTARSPSSHRTRLPVCVGVATPREHDTYPDFPRAKVLVTSCGCHQMPLKRRGQKQAITAHGPGDFGSKVETKGNKWWRQGATSGRARRCCLVFPPRIHAVHRAESKFRIPKHHMPFQRLLPRAGALILVAMPIFGNAWYVTSSRLRRTRNVRRTAESRRTH